MFPALRWKTGQWRTLSIVDLEAEKLARP